MLHEPAVVTEKDNAIGYKMRVGIVMFLIYAIIYAGFVIINVSKPDLMDTMIFSGLNLAVVYGFGLIIFALVLALIYNAMCSKMELTMNAVESKEEDR